MNWIGYYEISTTCYNKVWQDLWKIELFFDEWSENHDQNYKNKIEWEASYIRKITVVLYE